MMVLLYAGVALTSFLVGAVPFAWIIGKVGLGIDLRRVGSGNPGATNLYRTAGLAWGVPALLLDAAKGWLPAFLAARLFPEAAAIGVMAGGAAIAGHIWTPFLNFRGGKGVATAAGVFLGLNPLLLGVGLAVFLLVTAVSRYVSLGSLAGTFAAFLASFGLPLALGRPIDPYFVGFCGVCAAAIIFAHRKNISRLIAGTEGRIGKSRPKNGKPI